MYTKPLERSSTGTTDTSTASYRAMEKVIYNNRSCGWLIIRVIQIITCVLVLALSIFILTSTLTEDHVWRSFEGDTEVVVLGNTTMETMQNFFPLYIILGVSGLSFLSCFISLITYCCHRLSIKLVVFWDFLMATGWIIGSAFVGTFINSQGGWGEKYWLIALYKVNLILSILSIIQFIISAALGIRLHNASKRRANSTYYGPMRTPAPPYTSVQENGSTSPVVGRPYQSYSNFLTVPPPQPPLQPPVYPRPSGEWEAVLLDGKDAPSSR
ncbi:hypothetical protein P167DRAFT_545251 [Morchella conica CCBAS932]|uniref:MARVEL domain-containing protein n=1 Tax=Morchella conica CCBAS932 TaxID=1392247 RepID=A0A3N4KTP1_9PEZI|nr:hypothetical protein P167DRAFT_545251 [Morchella conica CCBAS932]